MPESTAGLTGENADRRLRGGSHPMLALIAFVATFLLTALGCAVDGDNWLVVAPFIIGALCCAILFVRLLIGEQSSTRWTSYGIVAHLCYVADEEWYKIAFLVGGTLVCSFFIARLIGEFVPIVPVARSSQGRSAEPCAARI